MNWDLIWITELVAVAVMFGVTEGTALIDKRRGDTLSERLRRWLGVAPRRPWRRTWVPIFGGTLIGVPAWFLLHLLIVGS